MHSHTITYENFNGETKTKVVNFNLTEAELTKLQKDYLHVGGINKVMDEAIASGDTRQLLDFFELLVVFSEKWNSADFQTKTEFVQAQHAVIAKALAERVEA